MARPRDFQCVSRRCLEREDRPTQSKYAQHMRRSPYTYYTSIIHAACFSHAYNYTLCSHAVIRVHEEIEVQTENEIRHRDITADYYGVKGQELAKKPSEPLATSQTDRSEAVSCWTPVCSHSRGHPVSHYRSNFSFPHQSRTKSLETVLGLHWVQELKSIVTTAKLSTCTSPLSIVASDSRYSEVLFNWLLFAVVKVSIPQDSIVIVSLDETLYDFLKMRNFTTIHVDAQTLFKGRILTDVYRYAQILMSRMSVLRLINHFGHDVIHYDPDAILLKDPWSLFYNHNCESDIVAGRGRYPFEINEEFGVTMCMGFAFFRSSPVTGIIIIILAL